MIRTVNEEPCISCKAQTNAYDQMRGRLCPNCAGVSEPLIDHSEDIEISASSYHISNAIWEEWLEKARPCLGQPVLLDVRGMLYKVALASAKVFALKDRQPIFTLPNRGVRKNCSRYAECISQTDWKTDHQRSSFSLKSCPKECEFYVESYSIWAFEEKTLTP